MANKKKRWILCSDIMPNDFYDKELKDDEGNILVGFWRPDANKWENDDIGWIENNIVAWRNLPITR